ncbi:MAG: DUF4476 domain-containing protein [Bacteroidia bacterium]|nr:DUF4476 domain-containing protein [Bacteroidia bacterium]MDW8015414.1 DUF4476 domain-containing protein [Bacteroidia bacterium]
MTCRWVGWIAGYLLAQGTGDLVVVSETGEPFRLYLNGEWLSEAPVTRVEAHEVPEGVQKATFYIYPSEGKVVQFRKSLHVEAGYVEYYAIRKRKGQYNVVLYNRTLRQEEETPLPTPPPSLPPQPSPPTPPSSQTQGTTIIFNPTIQVQTGNGTQISAPPAVHSPPPSSPPGGGSSYSGPCNCLTPMSRESFAQARSSLLREPFDEIRLEIAKGIARQNCLLAQDVRELAELLNFEENRLEFAEFAYDHTHDVSNYFTVGEAFQFSSTRERLMQFLQSRKARYTCSGESPTLPPNPSRACMPCMNNSDFMRALNTLRATASENARLEIARQIATTNCLSAEQVRDICRALSAEPNRLEFAKYAYSRSCDPQNYFIVNQAFASTLSQEELARYIQSRGGR